MADNNIHQLQDQQIATINVANKIRNTSLSKYQGLMPLFELKTTLFILSRNESKQV